MSAIGRATATAWAAALFLSVPMVTGAAHAAQAGELDPTWGTGGVSESIDGVARTAVLDATGNLYLAGAPAGREPGQTIVRYGPDGYLDPSFGPVTLPSASTYDELVLALHPATDGQRLLAIDGTRVHRFTASGAPDSEFGEAGVVQTPAVPGTTTRGVDLDVVPDGGRIVHLAHAQELTGRIEHTPMPIVLGVGGASYSSSIVVSAYDAHGEADRSFGTGGVVALPGPGALGCAVGCSYGGGRLVPTDVEITADGSVFVAGHWELGTYVWLLDRSVPREAIIIKLTPSGELDESFGERGLLRGPALATATPPGTRRVASQVAAVVEQPGAGLVVALQHRYDTGYGWFSGPVGADVRRVLADGSLDASFGDAGVTPLALPVTFLDHLEIDEAGARLVAFQDSRQPDSPCGCPPGAVLRLSADGLPDDTFGVGGVLEIGPAVGIGGLDTTGRVYVPRSESSVGPMHVSRYLAGPAAPTDLVTVTGTVTQHRVGTPIEGAVVACGSYSATTSAPGDYSLALPAGTYSCTASADGYRTAKETREVVAGSGPFDYELRQRK